MGSEISNQHPELLYCLKCPANKILYETCKEIGKCYLFTGKSKETDIASERAQMLNLTKTSQQLLKICLKNYRRKGNYDDNAPSNR